ncbi:MAG TPA: SbcC/MukB-like Walker B domain-containing protein, partial [Dehalococcoidia bacterium]|nr:SbcC/MukB-like Walker B domain-containing protein [Dehalococcoidia bacterium]
MTNNRLQVMMDTQRQTQRGSLTETLDIRISDELGTRNYELYSGGEAFRINLALRIALSKLLARRAGAPLPTLVIDEGFGSQDAAALERLIEAINVIQSDFQCLLVITHLAELRDQFPVQIVVSKTADGAFATVNA